MSHSHDQVFKNVVSIFDMPIPCPFALKKKLLHSTTIKVNGLC